MTKEVPGHSEGERVSEETSSEKLRQNISGAARKTLWDEVEAIKKQLEISKLSAAAAASIFAESIAAWSFVQSLEGYHKTQQWGLIDILGLFSGATFILSASFIIYLNCRIEQLRKDFGVIWPRVSEYSFDKESRTMKKKLRKL